MTDPISERRTMEPPPAPSALPAAGGFELNHPTLISLLYIASLALGVTALVGVVLAHVWRSDNPQAWEQSHFTYLIRTFWAALIVSVAGVILAVGVIGYPIMAGMFLLAAVLWMVVRSALSLAKAQKREPMPRPETLWL